LDITDAKVDPEIMRLAMRNWATGVTIVSSISNGIRHGMTVSSFTSVSIDPAMLLVSLQDNARTHRLVKESGVFAVTILDQSQIAISERFAGRQTEKHDRFRGLETFSLVTGAPLIRGGLVGFDCQVCDTHEIGQHTIFIGQVLAMQKGDGVRPLIYFDRRYHSIINS
jgi:flavin reductase (DIM6/NTAB) family NADH-FMN oxidoreductase RutF